MSGSKPSVDPIEQRLNRGVEVATLCAYYGGLLTERQREALRLHYEEDWSLSEIAERFEVSRQNVHELIMRSEEKLRRYEAELGSAARAEELYDKLAEASALLNGIDASPLKRGDRASYQAVLDILGAVMRSQEGEDSQHGI